MVWHQLPKFHSYSGSFLAHCCRFLHLEHHAFLWECLSPHRRLWRWHATAWPKCSYDGLTSSDARPNKKFGEDIGVALKRRFIMFIRIYSGKCCTKRKNRQTKKISLRADDLCVNMYIFSKLQGAKQIWELNNQATNCWSNIGHQPLGKAAFLKLGQWQSLHLRTIKHAFGACLCSTSVATKDLWCQMWMCGARQWNPNFQGVRRCWSNFWEH